MYFMTSECVSGADGIAEIITLLCVPLHQSLPAKDGEKIPEVFHETALFSTHCTEGAFLCED